LFAKSPSSRNIEAIRTLRTRNGAPDTKCQTFVNVAGGLSKLPGVGSDHGPRCYVSDGWGLSEARFYARASGRREPMRLLAFTTALRCFLLQHPPRLSARLRQRRSKIVGPSARCGHKGVGKAARVMAERIAQEKIGAGERGVALIAVLWMLVLLSLVAAAFSLVTRS